MKHDVLLEISTGQWGIIVTIVGGVVSFWANVILQYIRNRNKKREQLYFDIYSSCDKLITYAVEMNIYSLMHEYFKSQYFENLNIPNNPNGVASSTYDLPVSLESFRSSNKAFDNYAIAIVELNRNIRGIIEYLNKDMASKILELIFKEGTPIGKDYTQIFAGKNSQEKVLVYSYEWNNIRNYVVNTSEGKHLQAIKRLVLSTSKYSSMLLSYQQQ